VKVLSVVLENYGAFFGVHTFDCANRGLTIILGDNQDEPRMNSNGAAKSTLFEAIDWCWFGKPPKGDHADSVINDEVTSCAVTTYLEDDDGVPWVIQRARPAGLKLWRIDRELTCLDVKETQRAVERCLGMDRDVFKATVFFGQQDLLHFADVGEARRIELLTKIIPEMAMVDQYLERAKQLAQTNTKILEKAKADLVLLQGKLQGLEAIDYTEQRQRWEAHRLADRMATVARMQELESYVATHQGTVVRLPELEAQVNQLLTQPQSARQDYSAEIQQAEAQAAQYQANRSAIKAELGLLENTLNKINQTQTGKCSQCGQQVTEEHLAKERMVLGLQLQTKKGQADQALDLWLQAQKPVATLKARQLEADQLWAKAEEQRTAQSRQLNEEIVRLQKLQNYLESSKYEIRACRVKLEGIDGATNPFIEEMRKIAEQRASLAEQCSQASLAVEVAELELAYTDYWVKAFGPKGLKSYILDAKLQEMTDAANHWVKVLTGGTFWIRFETQKKGRSTKKLTNELNIRVFRYNPDGRISERNYKSWSGGEKKRVSLAIDFGLSRLVAKRARKNYDLLILDELFKHVDAAGGEAIAEMLNELRSEKSSIFVIEHNPDMISRFENRILVRRKGSRSTIVEVDNVEGDNFGVSRPGKKKKPKRKAIRRSLSSGAPIS
jgi:DNA repair exonuclease SbcCD ATPase subunit